MNYIIFDLEWNNAYNYAAKKGVNEIIEIGAIKFDENLNTIDTFKQLIKPNIAKKLSSRCKKLTSITMDEIKKDGVSFENAFSLFSDWCGNDDNLFLTWSNSDLYVLSNNFHMNFGKSNIDFIKKYCDAQKYCMSFIASTDCKTQISLSKCAELMNIDVDQSKLHRALMDCVVTGECFKKVFDKDKLKGFIHDCDNDYFERLIYKNTYINKPNANGFSLRDVEFTCTNCESSIRLIKPFENSNNTFKTIGACTKCNKKFWLYVRAKRTYDGVTVTSKAVAMNKRRANKIDTKCLK